MAIPSDRPKIGDWKYFPLIDFGIALLNTIQSKRLNLSYLSETEMQNLRITNEEWNLAISPIEIIRGLAALHALADGKCKIRLTNLISKALFGIKRSIGKTIHEDLYHLYNEYLKSLPKGIIKIFFEENHLLKFDNELMEYIEKYYGTESEETEMIMSDTEERRTKEVVQTICFQMNPNGQTLINEMNKNIKEATKRTVENVIRRDLPPKQRARLALITAVDSTFYWKPTGQVTEVEIFFYETFKKVMDTRCLIKGYRCDGLFRTCLTNDRVRIIELDSEIDSLKMYLFQPGMLFSKNFLKSLNAKKLQRYIDQIDHEPIKQSIIIPRFSITSPVGLRSVFASRIPFRNFFSKKKHPIFPYPSIARIFSPDKAEFGRIYGKVSQENYGPFHIYPLWEYYHKTKIVLKIGSPKTTMSEDEMSIITSAQRTMKEELTRKYHQQVVALTGRVMIIKDQVNRKNYMIGILGDEKDKDFDSKGIFSSLSKSETLNKSKGGNLNRISAIGGSNAVRKKSIRQPKRSLQDRSSHSLPMQKGIQQSTSWKKEGRKK
ncbi:unnamed protein product [Cercopithifilaria johnstoni]|uniref:Serpin domain-containing protein n=1 Tax=Cercopithifilaria johnstoni TaxID=2874296 RepID=A0A8J2MP52_9BILA|nr:unnamed protein product [Cercopithifilaria johnstoni]